MPSQLADSIRYDHPVDVIGGAGFVGSEAVRQLLAAGAGDVRVIDCQPATGALAERAARARLGWVPRYNDVDAALQTFACYLEHRNTAGAAPVGS